MRRLSKIVAVAACASVMLVGCGKNDDSKSDDKAAAGTEDVCESADGDGPKIGLAYDVGGRGDQSFNDSAYAGVERAVEELDATCFEAEAGKDEAESVREDRLRSLAEQGYSPVVAVGYLYSDAANVVAPDFPDTSFAVVDGFDPDEEANENVAYLGFAENDGSFLVGAAAALKSKTGTIGFVGGEEGDLIGKFEAGYTAGAKAVNPKIKVLVNYIGDGKGGGFNDPAGAKAAATGQYDKGADVVFHAAGNSGSGLFEAALAAKKWAIGVDSDQYLTAPADQKPQILTSMLKRVDVAAFDMAQSVADGEPLVSYQVYDLKVDGVTYSTSGGFVDDIASQLDEFATSIKDGKIKVPTAP